MQFDRETPDLISGPPLIKPPATSSSNNKDNTNVIMAERQTAKGSHERLMQERVNIKHDTNYDCPKFPAHAEVIKKISSFKD
jgi:hypothetical protein